MDTNTPTLVTKSGWNAGWHDCRGVAIIDHPEYGRIMLIEGKREDGALLWSRGTAIRLLPRDTWATLLVDGAEPPDITADLDPDMMSGRDPFRPPLPIAGEDVGEIARALGI